MPTRDDLHRIVDQLPEAVLEHAERVLEHCLTWPQPSPDVLELRDRVHKRKHQVTMEGRQQAYDRRVPVSLGLNHVAFLPARVTSRTSVGSTMN